MPMERRDPHSGALIFVPTESERSTIEQARSLKKQLAEVAAMKEELKQLIEQVKNKE